MPMKMTYNAYIVLKCLTNYTHLLKNHIGYNTIWLNSNSIPLNNSKIATIHITLSNNFTIPNICIYIY